MATFNICMIPVRRIATTQKYKPSLYEVALLKPTLPTASENTFKFISCQLHSGQPATEHIVNQLLMEHYNIKSLGVHPVSCCYGDNIITIVYIIPTVEVDNLPLNIEFINLEDLLEEPGQLNDKRDSLLVIDQWLSEQYYINTVNQEQLFTSDVSRVGVVQVIVTNPLRDMSVPPKEECLVLGFNNPTFPVKHE